MSIPIVRAALEKRLALLTPALVTAFENVTFAPVAGVPYQRLNLLPNTPDNSIMGSAVYFERGIFQISLMYPLGTGPGTADTQAQLLRAHFKRGTSMVEAGITVNIKDTPKVSPAFIDGDRYAVPISMSFQAQIETP